MAGTAEEIPIRVQGPGSPVPASTGSEQAGSPASSSNNRSASGVVNLASGALNATRRRSTSSNTEMTGTHTTGNDKLEKRYEEVLAIEEQKLKDLRNIIKSMMEFCESKKNMFLPIRRGLQKADYTLDEIDWNRKAWMNERSGAPKKELRRVAQTQVMERRRTVSLTQALITPESKKRPATKTPSPPTGEQERPKKKAQKEDAEGWTRVENRQHKLRKDPEQATKAPSKPEGNVPSSKKSGRTRRRERPDAVAIRPARGKKYADVLKDIRRNVKPDEMNVTVKSIRETRHGDVLVELDATAENRSLFGSAIQKAIGDAGSVRHLTPRAQVEIRDVDAATEEDEVTQALHDFLGEDRARTRTP